MGEIIQFPDIPKTQPKAISIEKVIFCLELCRKLYEKDNYIYSSVQLSKQPDESYKLEIVLTPRGKNREPFDSA